MTKRVTETLLPEECMAKIFELSGTKIDPGAAADLWPKILKHKWLLSEKVGRDVGMKIACIDFLENMEKALDEYMVYKRNGILQEMGAQAFGRGIWDTISNSQPPKQLIQRRIILPLTEEDLSRKHGVVPPKAIVFFGPPGTGKTYFAKGIAGILCWWYIEIVPSMLMADGVEKIGANLRLVMEKVRTLNEVVLFIDEFEEIAGRRDTADRIDKSITNEFLKQIPMLKSQESRILLVCATNYIRQLDAAMLRPARFDCIIPVGDMDRAGRETVFQYYLSRLNTGHIDLEQIVELTSRYTPADIEYLFHKVAQFSFEQELANKQNYLVTTETIMHIIPKVQPSLSDEIIESFEKDCVTYSRE